MAIILSDGTELFEVGKDDRGFTTFVDDNGRLLTNQNGRFIVSSNNFKDSQVLFSRVISDLEGKGKNESAGLLEDLQAQFKLSFPPKDAFKVKLTEEFLPEAEQQASEFFAPNREFIDDVFKQVEQQATEARDLVVGQTTEQFEAFQGVQDKGFRRSLNRASGRFAGKGTSRSGFRGEALDEFFEDKEATLAEQARGFKAFLDTEDLSLKQRVEQGALQKRGDILDIDRREEEKAQRISQRKLRERVGADEDLISGFANFLNQEVSA